MGVRAAGVAAIGLALMLPGGASASEVHGDATTGPDATQILVYDAAPGERNRVTVDFGARITIVDRGVRRIRAPRDAFGGCHATSRHRVVCDEEGVVFLRLRDRDDAVHVVPGGDRPDKPHTNPFALAEDYSAYFDDEGGIDATTIIEAGRGDDRITGSDGADWITAGSGSDRIDGRGGADEVTLTPDSAHDRVRAGGGIDSLSFHRADEPVTVNLASGFAWAAEVRDRIGGFERVHGGDGADTLLGSARGEAIYGEEGIDRIQGAGGNDLLSGDSPVADRAFANSIDGGDGDDVIDARGPTSAPTGRVDCGAGNDVETGEVDDLLAPTCEQVSFRAVAPNLVEEELPERPYQRALPLGVAGDGSPTFELRCPTSRTYRLSYCRGAVALERPPGAGEAVSYGSGSFDIPPGERAEVPVTLTDAGRGAIAAGEPVAVHVTADIGSDRSADFGWQLVIPR